ncbi:HAUS augmin-like complex subunit 6 N-terminus-domain-containing protein [Tuber brumale]|nr:HAUS augmin-like complex subunit 6 N-terminus-domain-containing protein [Tuber brumale]
MKSSPTVSLLLTNLRLLDYDGEAEDSFLVTPDVFTSLKNKGKAFEHIVYHLFSSFDPEECAIRLEGCWPIYEPAQSREFRNVVFKWLTDLKRAGQLGNILVRKTLLDDCSGERYEELLLALSTTVLKDRIENGFFKDVTQGTYAYNQTSSPAPRDLKVLILAHQASLSQLLHARRLSKAQWASFSAFLDTKEIEISALSQSLIRSSAEDTQKSLPRGYEEDVLRKWRNNWLGDQRWLDILLQGDPEFTREQFFELPFEKALTKHEHFKGGLVSARSGEISLRALEQQVQDQKRKLGELRQLRRDHLETIPHVNPQPTPKATSPEGTETKKQLKVAFSRHQLLHTGRLEITRDCLTGERNEYTELLASLCEDLAAASAPRVRLEIEKAPEYRFGTTSEPEPMGTEEGLSMDKEAQGEEQIRLSDRAFGEERPPEPENYKSEDFSIYPAYPRYEYKDTSPPLQEYSPSRKSPMKVSQRIHEYEPHQTNSTDASDEDEHLSSLEASVVSLTPRAHRQRDAMSVSPESSMPKKSIGRFSLGPGDDELLAEQIVSTVAGATYSPEKPSPVKRDQHHNSYELPQMGSPTSSLDESFDVDESEMLDIAQSPGSNRFPNRPPSLSPPDNRNLSTPMQSPSATTPKEDLLMSEDYNSVFKSRPKIALSPTFTPSSGTPERPPGLSLMSGVEGTPSAGYSEDESEDDNYHISSPLKLKSERRRRM